jgi:hypothetical protein
MKSEVSTMSLDISLALEYATLMQNKHSLHEKASFSHPSKHNCEIRIVVNCNQLGLQLFKDFGLSPNQLNFGHSVSY